MGKIILIIHIRFRLTIRLFSLFSENLSFLFSLLLFFSHSLNNSSLPFPPPGGYGGLFFYNFFAAPIIVSVIGIFSAEWHI